MMFSNCFLYLLLAAPALELFPMAACIFQPPLPQQPPPQPPPVPEPPVCPQAGLLNEKLQNLSTTLSALNSGLDCVFSIIDEQCPCFDAGSADCFETQVSDFRTALQELIADVANVTSSVPQDCPDRTGAVFVATCDGTDVAVVDPNCFIQNGFTTDTNVTRWPVYTNGDTYGFDYFRNDPFVVRCLSTPDGTEVILGSDTVLCTWVMVRRS
ncbi:uncharacterized protein LOC124144658 isoform X2 [Haliotis rufescens]|uniref:uncharacterized protein LOC124144658 isoform X2 n=1 Tax=Haliotis rufescens TaxID=6454 RepID=UPI001EB0808A|nr:uncharacterized protein LOC124144658 isoform X2 [Haliotis rufescens]